MTTLWQDIRYGLRMLAKSPGFTILVVVILGIGIGATTAMLSVVDAVMLRPGVPYRDPESLVCVYETASYVDPETGEAKRYMLNPTSLATFKNWQTQNDVFASLVGAHQEDSIVRRAETREKTCALYVSSDFFATLGARPILGRTFTAEEEKPGGPPVALLSYTHWQHWFGGDPNVIGETLIVNDQVRTVVGVLPVDFRWIFQRVACGLWMPMALFPEQNENRDFRGLIAIGRLQPGIDRAQAQAGMDVVAAQIVRQYPDAMRGRGVNVVPIGDDARRLTLRLSKPQTLAIMLSAIASVLLLASLHVASLLIARSAAREKEIVVRAALGAHRLRLVRQLLTESVLLAGLGGLFGTALTYWILTSLSALRGRSVPWFLGSARDRLMPWYLDIHMDPRSLVCIAAVSLLTCVVFGLLPALGASKIRLSEALSESRSQSRNPRFRCLRAGLVTLDIAIAFILLAGAALMVNSFTRLSRTDLQVNARNVLVADVALYEAGDRYAKPEQRIASTRRIIDTVKRLPGVRSVAVANGTPAWAGFNASPAVPVEALTADENPVSIRHTPVSEDYFRVLEIPLLEGRHFSERDQAGSTPVAIVSESLANRFWPNQNPIGRHLTQEERPPGSREFVFVQREVVGVVRDVKHLGEFRDTEEIYVPDRQDSGLSVPSVIVRTDGHTPGLEVTVRREIMALDPEVPVSQITSLQQLVRDLFSSEQSNALLLLSGAAVVALLLAGIGIYGTIAYTVSQRTHEIGIRMALGARSGDVVKAVLRQGLMFTLFGLALGLAGALAATRVIRSLLYDISATDPLTFGVVALLLAVVALLAGYIPARRAVRVAPMEALRYE